MAIVSVIEPIIIAVVAMAIVAIRAIVGVHFPGVKLDVFTILTVTE
jgi:hypothetical protein